MYREENDFQTHPIHDRYEANRKGVVRNVKNKKDLGILNNFGYIQIGITNRGIKKSYSKHRFIFECFRGKITNSKLVVDHINNIKTDNRLENLQLIIQSQNSKKNYKGRNRQPIRVRATNLNSGESFDYRSIYECGKSLDIHPRSISMVLKGITKTARSKLDKCKYYFEKLDQ